MVRSLLMSISALLVLLWAALAADTWIAQTGLIVFLIALLICGGVLLFAGLRDLIREISEFFYARSHKDHHVP